jgi:hypothetical protein
MSKLGKGNFYEELRRRLEENQRLYRGDFPFVVFDTPFGKFVASYLGVNPWKVLMPISFVVVVFFRVLLGRAFSELVLRVLGG